VEVVALDEEVAGAGFTAAELRHVAEQAVRHFAVVV
jgi:hypothetical protein